MNLDKYIEAYEITNDYHIVTLIDGSKHLLTNDSSNALMFKNYIRENFLKDELKDLKVTSVLSSALDNSNLDQNVKDALVEAVRTLEKEVIVLKMNNL
ncbi:hypothetical protein [Priestia megaterium]